VGLHNNLVLVASGGCRLRLPRVRAETGVSVRGHRGASRSRGGTRARRPHHVCPSGVHPPRLVRSGRPHYGFPSPKAHGQDRNPCAQQQTPSRSRQNTGRATGETRACDVATAGVTAGKSGDYATVDVSRVTNRKLVAGNGQTAPGRIHDLVGIGSEAEQHCPPSTAGRSPDGRDKPARRVLPVPEAHGPSIALTATRRGGRPL